MVTRQFLANVLPARVVSVAESNTWVEFAEKLGTPAVLLVQLDGVHGEMVQALEDASAAAVEPLRAGDGLAFGTTVGPPAPTSRSRPFAAPLDVTRLQTMFVKGPYYVQPLVKRILSGKTFTERISVGRARNNDVVLRHRSVSKFHAWFELGEKDELLLGDARSTNRTMLNGRPVGRDIESVGSGDELRFGSVSATVCAAEVLWQVLHGQPGSTG